MNTEPESDDVDDVWHELEDQGPMDLEDQLEWALDRAFPKP